MPLRVLLTQHQPADGSPSGRYVEQLVAGLRGAGHQVRMLLVDCQHPARPEPDVRRIVCHPTDTGADLKFALPGFDPQPDRQTFSALSDQQLAEYRDVLRKALDEEVAEFDPHLIHSQNIWLQGHLALEAGAPYLLSAWWSELEAVRRDARFRRFAQESAENAGRIVASDAKLASALRQEFGELDHRVVVLEDAVLAQAQSLYEAVLRQRFGHDFDIEST